MEDSRFIHYAKLDEPKIYKVSEVISDTNKAQGSKTNKLQNGNVQIPVSTGYLSLAICC